MLLGCMLCLKVVSVNAVYFRVLAQAAALPFVHEAFEGASSALARLRFHEGLRRRWENARAEAAVREATALALLEGARISVDDLRLASLEDARQVTSGFQLDSADFVGLGDAGGLLALGIWRAQWDCTTHMEALNVRGARSVKSVQALPGRLAGIHRNVCSPLVAAGLMPAGDVAQPVDLDFIRTGALLLRQPLPAVVIAADLWARSRSVPIFTVGSAAVGATLARSVLVEKAVDPSGVAVMSMWHAMNPVESATGLQAWRDAQDMRGDSEQEIRAAAVSLGQWLRVFAWGLQAGAEEGVDIAMHIQAGKL